MGLSQKSKDIGLLAYRNTKWGVGIFCKVSKMTRLLYSKELKYKNNKFLGRILHTVALNNIVLEKFMSRRSNKPCQASPSRRGATAKPVTAIASCGIVTIAICTGSAMWGYALINLASRA